MFLKGFFFFFQFLRHKEILPDQSPSSRAEPLLIFHVTNKRLVVVLRRNAPNCQHSRCFDISLLVCCQSISLFWDGKKERLNKAKPTHNTSTVQPRYWHAFFSLTLEQVLNPAEVSRKPEPKRTFLQSLTIIDKNYQTGKKKKKKKMSSRGDGEARRSSRRVQGVKDEMASYLVDRDSCIFSADRGLDCSNPFKGWTRLQEVSVAEPQTW